VSSHLSDTSERVALPNAQSAARIGDRAERERSYQVGSAVCRASTHSRFRAKQWKSRNSKNVSMVVGGGSLMW
jgi:hypothetical protein